MNLPSEYNSLLFLKLPVRGNIKDYPEELYELAESCGVTVEQIAESRGGIDKKTTAPTMVWFGREVIESVVAGHIRAGETANTSYIELPTGDTVAVLVNPDELVKYVEGFILLEFEDEDVEPAAPVVNPKKTKVNEKPKN